MKLRFLRLILLPLLSPFCLQAEDWPHWLGLEANGISSEVLPDKVELTNVIWTAEVGTGFSSLAVAAGRVYSMGHKDGKETVWCFSEKEGNLLWSDLYQAELMPNLHEGGPGATPTVDGDRVYTMSKDGQLRVYEAASGTLVWEKDMLALSGMRGIPEWGFTASPLVSGDTLFVEAGATFAFDKSSGDERWRSEDYRPAYGTPQLFEHDERLLLAVLKTDGLVILDPAHGKTLAFSIWRTSFQTNSTTPLAVGDGRLFVSTGYDEGCALFRYSEGVLTKIYENKNMCNHMGNSVLIDGFFYGFDGTAHRGRPVEFTALDGETGEKKWHFQDLKYGSVIGANKDLIVLTETGEMLIGAASPDGFEPRVRHQVLSGRCWTPPVLANGVIYARNASGTVVALRVQ
tara:strand:+ start:88 stop:1293 length:1206 start_codon:yes stop_codon:yes gene_type:complete